MIGIFLELNDKELSILKNILNMHQNLETMEILKQIEEQEILNGQTYV